MFHFFALHLTLRGKLDFCGHNDFFFSLHLILREKLDIRKNDDFSLLRT